MKICDPHSMVPKIVAHLRETGAINVERYERKLRDNVGVQEIVEDLLAEAHAAIMFLRNNFKVTMRESPDLQIELDGEITYVEVKHFREKPQDLLDKRAMRESEGLVRVSNTAASQNYEPWEQIAMVAIKTATKGQYMQNAPNLLVIETDSNAISGIYLSTAINHYTEYASQTDDPRLHDLNAIILMDKKYYPSDQIEQLIGSGSRNVIFRQIVSATTPLNPHVIRVLENIRLWW
jgi:hypothetical protein